MMGVKGGTQTWSNSVQRADLPSDGKQSISSADREKYFQDENVGETLNKLTDPNYVDESKKLKGHGNNQLDKDSFMTLLLTQMKNQDPTNPLKSHEMAAQLAQFTQLEKLNNINEGITGMRKDAQPNQNFQALSFIGKTVNTDNSKITRMDADEQHEIRFSLPADAQKFTLQVKDAEGNVVRTIESKGLKAGKNQLSWNGMKEDGTQAAPGEYTATMEAVGSNGRKLFVETKTEGVITGVNFTARGPQLMVGKQVLNMADIKSISDPNVMPPPAPEMSTPKEPNSKMMPIGPKKAEVKPEAKPNAAKHANLKQGNLNDAAMAQGLINKLNKEGAKAGGMG